ncbi:hypothetical protein M8818_005321 [Zalaria obscura]|uniref:Uncharacterized protein n=1 Tax=Zalaria obscura TaxID=2024903 RepID=A0ACC3SCC5_9PEZI
MATLAANASPEEIFEEIAFQNVLLESLDAGADDHGERRQEIEDTIAGLEARLPAEDGQEQNNDDTAIPEDVTWTGDEPWPFDHWTEEENGLAGWSNTEVYDAAPPANVTPTESGGSSSASSFQTSSLKRPHDTLNLTPDSEALSRSKRPTPNLSRSGTPSSLSSLDVGSLQVQARRQNSYATETARRRQLMAERAAQRRRERERTDAEFAALLSQRSPEPAPTAGPSRAAPDINTLPGPFDNWVDPDSSTWHSTAETLAPVFTRIKAERQRSPSPAPQRSSSVANWPTQVVDLTGSDDEDDVVPYNQVPLPDHPQPFIPPPQNSHSVINNAYQRALAIGRSAFTTFGDYANPWSELENLLNPASSSHTPGRYESVYDPVAGMPQPGHVDWDSVLQNSETTKEDLLKLMDNVRPDEEIPVDMQPVKVEGLEVALKPYQAAGLKWLQDMDAGSNKGGILADDMGLGKTVQAIALMVTRRSEDPLRKTNLILAPVALLRQWKEEIMSKVRPGRHRLSVFIHHANSKAKSFSELRNYDVVLTTFGTIASELKRHDRYQARKKADPEAVERADEKTIFISQNSKFFRIIIDEAQCIKNKSTQTAQAVYLLQARSRFCMTGTPMMNSVDELQSLIRFIRIKPYKTTGSTQGDSAPPDEAVED